MSEDPYLAFWSQQFGALVRDKAREALAAIEVTGWDTLAHVFPDPYDDDKWRLVYDYGEFYVVNLSLEEPTAVRLDLEALGVFRDDRE